MLDKTFCHVEGISVKTEKILWENDVISWDHFILEHESISYLPKNQLQKIKFEIEYSKLQLQNKNLTYFKEKLPSNELWRSIGHGRVAFIDIETTGLSRWTDDITMIGIYDGNETNIFIKGINLNDALNKLNEYDIFVTFNGKVFDIPFIEHKFKTKFDSKIHLDLRYLLKEFGFSGGLKNIEKLLNIVRDDEVKDMGGRLAVRLWREYERGNKRALALLIKYNEEDIINLEKLLSFYLTRKKDILPIVR